MPVLSHPFAIITYMKATGLDEVIELTKKANADLEPDLLTVPQAKARLRIKFL